MRKSILLAISLMIMIGCAKKIEPLKIAGWEKFQEPYLRISFTRPAGWHQEQSGRKITFYSSPEQIAKFTQYLAEGEDGARIMLQIQKLDTLKTLAEYSAEQKNLYTSMGFDVSSLQQRDILDIPGTQIEYAGALDAKNRVSGVEINAMRDSMLYTVRFEGYNQVFTTCKPALDSLLASLHLPAPRVRESDPSIPAEDFEVFENDFLKINYPANFEPSSPAVKEPIQFELRLMGYRKDSGISIDVRPAQGLTLEKVIEQNEKFFKNPTKGTATISGLPATFLNYSPVKDIQSRAYFVVKDDKIYRCILNYFSPMKSVYLPVFEKVISALVIK